jgi:hypothetical protein
MCSYDLGIASCSYRIMSVREKWPPWDYTAHDDHLDMKVLPLKVPEGR